MRHLKIGVLGLGIGEQHVKKYQNISGCSVSIIYDIDLAHAQTIQKKYDIPYLAQTSEEFFATDLDAISICSYDDNHAESIIKALETGKHVMCEKPLVLFPEDLENVVKKVKDSGLIVTSNLILRQSLRFQLIKKTVQEGAIGKIFYMEADYLHAILEKITHGWRGSMPFYCVTYGGGIHMLDLLSWIIQEPFISACGMGTKLRTENTSYPYPDTLCNILKFSGGALAKSTTSFSITHPRKFHTLKIYGDQGTIEHTMNGAFLHDGHQTHILDAPYPGVEKGDLLPNFIQAIQKKEDILIPFIEVEHIMRTCFACWNSVLQGREVAIPPIKKTTSERLEKFHAYDRLP